VTREASLGEQRPDIPLKIESVGGHGGNRADRQSKKREPNGTVTAAHKDSKTAFILSATGAGGSPLVAG
jgi:hypothetical protein